VTNPTCPTLVAATNADICSGTPQWDRPNTARQATPFDMNGLDVKTTNDLIGPASCRRVPHCGLTARGAGLAAARAHVSAGAMVTEREQTHAEAMAMTPGTRS